MVLMNIDVATFWFGLKQLINQLTYLVGDSYSYVDLIITWGSHI